MFSLQPGQNQYGNPCQHCVKSMKKYNTYCSIASHHRKRVISGPKSKATKKIDTEKMKHIFKLTEEYSYQSLIAGVIFMDPTISSLAEILKMAPKLKTSQLNSYLVNLHLVGPDKIQKYMEYMGNIKEHFPNIQESKLVKKNVFTRRMLNMDLVIRNLSNQNSGFLIQKTYYLLKKPLSKFYHDITELQETKRNLLEYHGYYQYDATNNSKIKEIKEVMFYRPQTNPYYNQLILKIREKEQSICEKIVYQITFPDVNHPVYLLDGKTFHNISLGNENWKLQHDTQYLGKPGIRYFLSQDGISKYKIYIGWDKNYFGEPELTIMKTN